MIPLWSENSGQLWNTPNHKVQVWLNPSWRAFQFGKIDRYKFIGYQRRFFRFGRLVICFTGKEIGK